MRRTSATTLAQHDHHHQQQSTAKARTSVIIVAFLSGSRQYYYYCNHYCINISIALLFFHCGPKRMSGISISFLYCWYHYTNSHFVCIIATASLVSKFKTVISFAPPRSHRSIGFSSRGHFDHFFEHPQDPTVVWDFHFWKNPSLRSLLQEKMVKIAIIRSCRVYNGFRILICSFPYLNLILAAWLEHPHP